MSEATVRTPTRLELLRNLQISQVDVVFAVAFMAMSSGAILIGFIKNLGGGDLWISLAAAVPSLMGLVQIPGAIWGRSFDRFKGFIAPGGWAWRLLYLPFVFLPLAPLNDGLKLYLVIGCIGLAAFSISIVQPIYNDWLAEMVPTASRGDFFSRRVLVATAGSAIGGLVASAILDQFRRMKMEDWGFTVVFTLGWIMGILSMIFFMQMKDSPRSNPKPANIKEGLRQLVLPARDKNFALLLFFVAVFACSQGYAGQFFAAYCLEVLNQDYTFIQLLGVSHTISTVVAARMWGFLCDRYGNKPILTCLVAASCLTPFQWVFSSPGHESFYVPFLLGTHLFNGFIWSGIGVAQFNLYITTSTPEDRPNYLAAATAVSTVALGVSPMLGYWSMEFWRTVQEAEWAYKIVFLTLILIRVIATIIILPVREPGAKTLKQALSELIKVKPKGVRALKKIARSTDETSREKAVSEVGASGLSMGYEELSRALVDPSPKVRRGAARSLGLLRSPDAASVLDSHLSESPEMATEEALEALGECGGQEAVRTLSRFLKDPRAILRRAAAKGLGSTGASEAIDPLIESAAMAGDPDVRRASLQALRLLEADGVAGVFGDALWDQHPSIRAAAAEGISELQITSLAPTLRESITWFGDDTASEMAYALGVVGDKGDLPAILATADAMVSRPLRLRCLMGAARLLGLEKDFYRLVTLEGMPRDNELLKTLKPGMKNNPEWSAAIDRYSQEETPEAAAMILDTLTMPEAKPLRESSSPEVFLLAVLLAGQSLSSVGSEEASS